MDWTAIAGFWGGLFIGLLFKEQIASAFYKVFDWILKNGK